MMFCISLRGGISVSIRKFLFVMLLICAVVAAALQPAFAAAPASKIPNEFWKLNPLYDNAVKANDLNNIIQYGNKIIDLFNGMEETRQVLEIVTPRLEKVAKAYEAAGDYPKAVETYTRYIPNAEKLGWKDGVTYAISKVNSLGMDIEIYTKVQGTTDSAYFGAKHEPKNGIYFGTSYDQDPRIGKFDWNEAKKYFPKKNTAYLTYLHWEENIKSFDRYYQDAKQNNIAVQIAWNIEDAKFNHVLKNITSYEKYIKATANYLKNLDIPVFLRFACEMNIKENSNDSSTYISAFRYVSEIMKELAPNVAMVWAPNDISAKGRSFEQYYPGDEYVDWIGISTYTYRYFQGKKDWGSLQDSIDSVFLTGDYANPIKKINPIIEAYGSKKPIMISETGIGHTSKTAGEDLSDWAIIQLRRLYFYAPMLYPQLKGIFYFNVNNDIVTKYDDYSLYGNQKINALYNEAVNSDYFVSGVGQAAPFRYERITDFKLQGFKLPLMTYAIVPKVLKPAVQYKLDGKLYGTRTELPYSIDFDFSGLPAGEHVLSVEIYDGSNKVGSKSYKLVTDAAGISLKAN